MRVIVPDNAYWLAHYDVVVDGVRHLPLVVLLDVRDMKAQAILSNPSNEELLDTAAQVLARLDGKPAVTPPTRALVDSRFTPDQWGQIALMALPANLAPPTDPTNRYEARADAVSLGRLIFNDERLGSAGTVGCVTCHPRDGARMDARPTARGISPAGLPVLGDRNTPSLIGAAFSRWQLWDGRADSLWAQALGPFEDAREISSNRLRVVRTVLTRYPGEYRTVFGSVPDFSGLPTDGKPGTAAWEAMPAASRQLVTATYANLGKTVAAYVRRILPAEVALDRYARGDLGALTERQKDGLLRFFAVGCIQCHHGWRLSDGSWHANYFPTGRQDCQPDVGRESGVATYAASEFRGDGVHSDDRAAGARLVGDYRLTGRFKTQGLRGVADTAPYTHGGAVADLDALVKLYSEGGLPDSDPVMAGEPPPPPGCPNPRPARTRGDRDLGIVRFNAGPLKDPATDAALVEFLRTLRATAVDPD
jgi:cytochrome c peroxidase